MINSIKIDDFDKLGELKELESLNCSRCLNIVDESLIKFTKNHLNLKSFKISGCVRLTEKSIKEVFNFENLEELDLSMLFMTDSCLSKIGKLHNLSNLNISGCVNINDANCLISLKLFSINVSGISAIDNSILTCLINNGLKIIRASNCTKLTNDFLKSLVLLDKCDLMLLEINRTPKITDNAIASAIVKFQPNLRIIRSTNLVHDPKNIGLKLPLPLIGYERPVLPGMKKNKKKVKNDKGPIKMLEKFEAENKPIMLLDYFKKY